MSLAGQGVIAIWNGITDEGRANFFEWHNREHMPERVGIPGFLRGRRYIALRGTPEFFTLYETDHFDRLVGKDYLDRLNDPTPWTKKSVVHFTDTSRALTRVRFSGGSAAGGFLLTLRFDCRPGQETALEGWLAGTALPAILAGPAIVGAHLCVTDRDASSLETAEKRARAQPTGVPNWLVMVEGGSAAAIDRATVALLDDAALLTHGADGPGERGLYQLEADIAKLAM